MKIAYVINSLEGGGAAFPVPAVTRVMRDFGAQVKVFALTRRDGRALPTMLDEGLEVQVREGGERDHWAAARWLDRELLSYRPSHLWTSLTRATVIGMVLGMRRGIPVVAWQHNEYLNRTGFRVLHLLRRCPAAWVCDSDLVTRLTAERFGVTEECLFTWPLFAADPEAPQAQPWRQGEVLRLGSLGRLARIKGYDVLIEALGLLRERAFQAPIPFEISIAGDGEEYDALTRAARAVGCEQLRLVGFSESPREFLAGLHLYLQPSRGEGLCIAMHEAMQAGLPVIASAVGQMPYTLEAGRSGWLVPPADASALADALAAALSDPMRLTQMGAVARQHVLSRFSAEAFRDVGASVMARLAANG